MSSPSPLDRAIKALLAVERAWIIHGCGYTDGKREARDHLHAAIASKVEEAVAPYRKLLENVRVSEFEGVYCVGYEGRNWFDMRDELLAATPATQEKP